MSKNFKDDARKNSNDYYSDLSPIVGNEILSTNAYNRVGNNIYECVKNQLYYNLFSNDTANTLSAMRFIGTVDSSAADPAGNGRYPCYLKATAKSFPGGFTGPDATNCTGYVELSDQPNLADIGYTGGSFNSIAGVSFDVGELNSAGNAFKLVLLSYNKDADVALNDKVVLYMSVSTYLTGKMGENISILLKHDPDLSGSTFDITKANKLRVKLNGEEVAEQLPITAITEGYLDIHTHFVVKFNKDEATLQQLADAINSIKLDSTHKYFNCVFSDSGHAMLSNVVSSSLMFYDELEGDPEPTTTDNVNEYTISLERPAQYFDMGTGFDDFYSQYFYNLADSYALLAYTEIDGIPRFKYTGVMGFYGTTDNELVSTEGLERDPIFANGRNVDLLASTLSPVGFISDTHGSGVTSTDNIMIQERYYRVINATFQGEAIQDIFYPFMVIEPTCIRFMNGVTIKLSDVIKFGSGGMTVDASTPATNVLLESNVLFDIESLSGMAADAYKQMLSRYKETIRRDTGSVPSGVPTSITTGGASLQVLSEMLGKDADFGMGLLDGKYIVVDRGYGSHITDSTNNPGTNRFSSLEDAIVDTYTNTERSTIVVQYNSTVSNPEKFEIDVDNLISEFISAYPLQPDPTSTEIFNMMRGLNIVFYDFPNDVDEPRIVLNFGNDVTVINYSTLTDFEVNMYDVSFYRYSSANAFTENDYATTVEFEMNGTSLTQGPTYHIQLTMENCNKGNAALSFYTTDFATLTTTLNQARLNLVSDDKHTKNYTYKIDTIRTGWDVVNLSSSLDAYQITCNHFAVYDVELADINIKALFPFNVNLNFITNSNIRIDDLRYNEAESSREVYPGDFAGSLYAGGAPYWDGAYGKAYLNVANVDNTNIKINDFKITHAYNFTSGTYPYGQGSAGTASLVSIISVLGKFIHNDLSISQFTSSTDLYFNGLDGVKVFKTLPGGTDDYRDNTIKLGGLSGLLSNAPGTGDIHPAFASTGDEYYTDYSALLDFYAGYDFQSDLASVAYSIQDLKTKFMVNSNLIIEDKTPIYYGNEEEITKIPAINWNDPNYTIGSPDVIAAMGEWYDFSFSSFAAFIFGMMDSNVDINTSIQMNVVHPFGTDDDPSTPDWGKPISVFYNMWHCNITAKHILNSSQGLSYTSFNDFVDYVVNNSTAAYTAVFLSQWTYIAPIMMSGHCKMVVNEYMNTFNNTFLANIVGVDFETKNYSNLFFWGNSQFKFMYNTVVAGALGCNFSLNSTNPLLCSSLLLTDFGVAPVTNINIDKGTFAWFALVPLLDKPSISGVLKQSKTVSNIVATQCRFLLMNYIYGLQMASLGEYCSFYGELHLDASGLTPYTLACKGSNLYGDMSLAAYSLP